MSARRVVAVVPLVLEHDAGPDVDDEVLLAEVTRQVLGLGPVVVEADVGGVSVWVVVDGMAERSTA